MAGLDRVRLKAHALRSPLPGPVRLLVGGLHGREGRVTRPLLEALVEEGPPRTGSLVVVPALSWGRPYMTTLSPAYYETVEGRRVLALLQKYRPEMYLELHCYRLSAHEALTNPARRAMRGVPPLMELEQGVLLGSVSPHLLSRFDFKLCLVLEVSCLAFGGCTVALEVMRAVRDAAEPEEVLEWLRARHEERLGEGLERLGRSVSRGPFGIR